MDTSDLLDVHPHHANEEYDDDDDDHIVVDNNHNNNNNNHHHHHDEDRDEEDEEFEQLALNSNFDPVLLDCWDEEEGDATNADDREESAMGTANAAAAPGCSGSRSSSARENPYTITNHHRPEDSSAAAAASASLEDAAWEQFDNAQQALILAVQQQNHSSNNHDDDNDKSSSSQNSNPSRGPLCSPPALGIASALLASGNHDHSQNNAHTNTADEIPTLPSPFEPTATGLHSTAAELSSNTLTLEGLPLQIQQPLPLPPFYGSFPGTSGGMAPSFLSNTMPLMCNSTTGTPMDSSMLLPLAFNALAAGVDLTSFFCLPPVDPSVTSAAAATPPPEVGGGHSESVITTATVPPNHHTLVPPSATPGDTTAASASLPDNAMLPAEASAAFAASSTTKSSDQQHQKPPPPSSQQSQQQQVSSSSKRSANNNNNTNNNNAATATTTTKKRASGGGTGSSRRGRKSTAKGHARQARNGRKGKNKPQDEEEEEEEPPFMLFDATVELRHNFIQSQRAHGLPVLQDNNSYHFARSSAAVTPPNMQHNHGSSSSNNNNNNTTASEGAASMPLPMFVSRPAAAFRGPVPRLVDARHGDDNAGNKRIKNAKEQKRAQRITELIEQLRIRMEKGGWKVGIKSKLHTLSSCSDYVKHLVKTTKEKESAVEQAKRDLETKQRKLEEEKSAAQQDPSEPESTTSSLTVSSGSRSTNKHNSKKDPPQQQRLHFSNANDQNENNTTLKSPPQNGGVGTSSAEDSGQSSEHNKKRKHSSNSNSQETNSEDYSSSLDHDDYGKKQRTSGGGGLGGHVFVGYKSSVSDITDHNKYAKGSSTTGSDENTMTAPAKATLGAPDNNDGATPPIVPSTQSTVCSDAAVVETSNPKGPKSHDSSTAQGDRDDTPSGMAIQTITTTNSTSSGHRKRKQLHDESRSSTTTTTSTGRKSKLAKSFLEGRDSTTSLERNFELDYQEVFLKSNVPQLIATTTGRILVHNDIFLRATRLRRSHVERMTIFSLVQPGMLSNLFELVASSLREDDNDQKQQEEGNQQQQQRDQDNTASAKKTNPLHDYSTMTLPCVTFADRPTLFMTITLMKDEDVRKRCFHCVFTDRAPGGAKGSVGAVTPQLMQTLFQSKPQQQQQHHHTRRAGSSSGGSTSRAEGSNQGSGSSESNTQTSSGRTDNSGSSDTKTSANDVGALEEKTMVGETATSAKEEEPFTKEEPNAAAVAVATDNAK
ncbi:hypothetical protein ACA910_012079 [Epithemia clementina (nom. ined.)]